MSSSLTPAEIRYYKEHARQSLQPNMIAMNICGIVLPYIAVALRLIARTSSVATIGADDWIIFAALVSLDICTLWANESSNQLNDIQNSSR